MGFHKTTFTLALAALAFSCNGWAEDGPNVQRPNTSSTPSSKLEQEKPEVTRPQDKKEQPKAEIQPVTISAPPATSYRFTAPAEVVALDKEGLNVGPVVLHPKAQQIFTYNDNVYGAPRKAENRDFIKENFGGLELLYKRDHFNLNVDYTFGWHDYLDNKVPDYYSHDARLNAVWTDVGFTGFDIALDENYQQSVNTSTVEDNIASFVRYQSNAIGTTFRYKTGRISAEAGYHLVNTDYFGRTTDLGDYGQRQVDTSLAYKVNDSVIPYFKYGFKRTVFANVVNQDYDLHEFRVGTRAKLGIFKFDFSVGDRRGITYEPRYDSNNGLVTGLRIDLTPLPKLNLYTDLKREFSTGVRTGVSKIVDFEVGGSYLFTPQFGISWRSIFQDDNRYRSFRQRTIDHGFRATYKAFHYLLAYAGFGRSERSSDFRGARDVTTDRIELGLSFRW